MSLAELDNEVNTDQVEGGDGIPEPPSTADQKRPVGLVGLLLGGTAILSTCLCGPLFLAGLITEGVDEILMQQAIGPFVLALGLGGMLAWEGWQVWEGAPARRFWPRRTWILWLVFALFLTTGLLISLTNQLPILLGLLINAITLAFLPLLILATVGKLLKGADGTWRDVTAGLISGASIGTGLALIAEVGLAVLGVAFLAAFELIPGGLEGLQSLIEQINDPSFDLLDPQTLPNFLSPGLVLIALVFIAIATPLIEEVVKTLGVGVAGRWLRPSPPRAFLLGVASGAGFALVENLLNGIVGGVFWLPSVLSRLAATLMHCATGGLLGWGWGQLWSERQLKRWLIAFVGAVSLHGIWNGTVGTMVATGLLSVDSSDPILMATSGFLILGLLVALALLILISLGGLLWGSWMLGHQHRQAVDPTSSNEA